MNRPSIVLLAASLLASSVVAKGACYNQDGVARISCPAEACNQEVPGCTRSNWVWLTDGCVGVGVDCSIGYFNKDSCNSQYGCEWDSEAPLSVAVIVALSLAFVAMCISFCALGRWLILKQRARVQQASLSTTTTLPLEKDSERDEPPIDTDAGMVSGSDDTVDDNTREEEDEDGKGYV